MNFVASTIYVRFSYLERLFKHSTDYPLVDIKKKKKTSQLNRCVPSFFPECYPLGWGRLFNSTSAL